MGAGFGGERGVLAESIQASLTMFFKTPAITKGLGVTTRIPWKIKPNRSQPRPKRIFQHSYINITALKNWFRKMAANPIAANHDSSCGLQSLHKAAILGTRVLVDYKICTRNVRTWHGRGLRRALIRK